MKQINLRNKGSQFKMNFTSSHWIKRNSTLTTRIFVGNLSYIFVKEKIGFPKTYGDFYNNDLKYRVENLYKYDLQLYNYTYPY